MAQNIDNYDSLPNAINPNTKRASNKENIEEFETSKLPQLVPH